MITRGGRRREGRAEAVVTGSPAYREVHLGQVVYLILWDDDTDRAAVARAEVVQYASDWSKVRVRVVDAPQLNVIGRSSWVLPDRLDDDPRTARLHYHRRAREETRYPRTEDGAPGEDSAVEAEMTVDGSAAPEGLLALWRPVAAGWQDVDLLIDSVDFESGWPENQSRLAKFATFAFLRLEPQLRRLLADLPAEDARDTVLAALETGLLAAVRPLCAGGIEGVLARWDEVPPAEVGAAADYFNGLRVALDALAEAHGLLPRLRQEA